VNAILTITTRRECEGNSPATPTIQRPSLTRRVAIVAVTIVSMLMAAPTAHASVGGEIIKAIGRYLAKETGQEATEQAVKQMTKQVGEELIERTAQKVVREGGEKSLVEVGELVAKHGPDVVRALDNAPDALPVLKLLNELPADEIGKAASRLAAGSTGKELATLGTKVGVVALRAEAKHPGVGVRFAKALGSDGAELSLKLTSDQAVQIGRHVDDIAQLPTTQQSQLMSMISSNADRFAAFVGRFVEKNPGKVLFTAASTPIILANSAAIFGDGEVVFDADGNVIRDANGAPIRHHTGLIPDVAQGAGEAFKAPVQTTLYWAGGIFVVLLSLFGVSKVWKHNQKDRLDVEVARTAALNHATANTTNAETAEKRLQ
jgi:hypothetical protein